MYYDNSSFQPSNDSRSQDINTDQQDKHNSTKCQASSEQLSPPAAARQKTKALSFDPDNLLIGSACKFVLTN